MRMNCHGRTRRCCRCERVASGNTNTFESEVEGEDGLSVTHVQEGDLSDFSPR